MVAAFSWPQAELGTREHYRDNVTMFLGLKLLVIALVLYICCGHSVQTLRH